MRIVLKIFLLPVALICFLLSLIVVTLGAIARHVFRFATFLFSVFVILQIYNLFKYGLSEIPNTIFMTLAAIAFGVISFSIDMIPEF